MEVYVGNHPEGSDSVDNSSVALLLCLNDIIHKTGCDNNSSLLLVGYPDVVDSNTI